MVDDEGRSLTGVEEVATSLIRHTDAYGEGQLEEKIHGKERGNPRLRDKPRYILSRLMQAGHDQQRFAKRPVLLRYSVAAFAVAVALLIKLLLEPLIVQETPFLLVFVAILLSAWYGGLGPGLAATAGAALIIDYFFLPPLYSFTVTAFDIKAVPLGAFVLEGVLFTLIVTALRSVQHRAEAKAPAAHAPR